MLWPRPANAELRKKAQDVWRACSVEAVPKELLRKVVEYVCCDIFLANISPIRLSEGSKKKEESTTDRGVKTDPSFPRISAPLT